MSSNTWTPAALSSDASPLKGACWRVVEAQHHVSTLKLVDSTAEQEVLEDLIDASKPSLPPECQGLHYLLATPFRYGAANPAGSRFRRAGLTEGVFYSSETPETAIAEMAFYRLLFFAESPDTPWPANPAEYTGFSIIICDQARHRSDPGPIHCRSGRDGCTPQITTTAKPSRMPRVWQRSK